jgi:hydrogenase-4 component F
VRFHLVTVGALGADFSSSLLVAFGLLSLAVALPFLIVQQDLKRLLAYSSIEHMGLLALGIGFGGQLALAGVVLHVALHAVVKASLFLSAGELVQQYGSRRIARIRGTLAGAPIAGGSVGVGIALLGGLPPSSLFVTEFAIVVGGVTQGYGLAAAAAAVLLALGAVALAFHGTRLLWGGSASGNPERLGTLTALRLGLPLFAVSVLGLWTPGPLSAVIDAVRAVLEAAGG